MKVALLFPGQGSQAPKMLSALAAEFPQIQERFAVASEIVKKDLWQIAQDEDNHLLNFTALTQPILLAAGMGCYDVLREELKLNGDFFGGHSLGEYTALCAAGAISFEKAVELVHTRGTLMQEAVQAGEGAMAAILGLTDEQILTACEEGGASAANFNSPGQVVIAGKTAAVEKTIEIAKSLGAKRAVLLPVSVPSHCDLMKPAAAKLSAYLEHIVWQNPSAAVIHNVDAGIRNDCSITSALLGKQLYRPVLWTQCIERLRDAGAELFIELGPSKVLTGLNKRIDKNLKTIALDVPAAISEIQTALGKL